MLYFVIVCVLNVFFYNFLYYLLFRLFDFFGFKKLALSLYAMFDAPFCGWNAKKIRNYCRKHCPDKQCKNCIYWTCESYKNGGEK